MREEKRAKWLKKVAADYLSALGNANRRHSKEADQKHMQRKNEEEPPREKEGGTDKKNGRERKLKGKKEEKNEEKGNRCCRRSWDQLSRCQ